MTARHDFPVDLGGRRSLDGDSIHRWLIIAWATPRGDNAGDRQDPSLLEQAPINTGSLAPSIDEPGVTLTGEEAVIRWPLDAY